MFLIHNKFSEHPLSHEYKIRKKIVFPCDENSGITLLTNFMYNREHSINYVDCIITLQYMLILIYLVTGNMYLLTAFNQLPLSISAS